MVRGSLNLCGKKYLDGYQEMANLGRREAKLEKELKLKKNNHAAADGKYAIRAAL